MPFTATTGPYMIGATMVDYIASTQHVATVRCRLHLVFHWSAVNELLITSQLDMRGVRSDVAPHRA
jgi:hypothetical protein